jgi:imidazolonepropionase-like amidohydrolase
MQHANADVNGQRTVLRGGQLLDGTGADPIPDAVVVCEKQIVVKTGSASHVALEPTDQVIDLRPWTLMPGMIDAHLHLWGLARSPDDANPVEQRALRAAGESLALLHAGFTTVRDCGSNTTVMLKRMIDQGRIPGPRIIAAGMAIARPGHHWLRVDPRWRWTRPANSVDDCRAATRLAVQEQSDFIKIATSGGIDRAWGEVPTFTVDEVKAITDEAHQCGLRVASHSMGTEGVRRAVLGGVDTVEHAYNIDEETLDLIIEHRVFIVPTLRIMHKGLTPWGARTSRDQIHSLKKAYDAGAMIAMGTDSTGGQHFENGPGNGVECAVMSQVMATRDVLTCTTRTAARALGIADEVGTIEPGKCADIIAVRDDPLNSIETLQRSAFVMHKGQVVRRDETDAIRAED